MSENRGAALLRVSAVGPQWVQVGSTSTGGKTSTVETAGVSLAYLAAPALQGEPRIQVGEPTAVAESR
jgi:hypothetical protein